MKSTALTQLHTSLGAKMVPFAGYNMPVSYSGLNEEHLTVRNSVGVFDVSHMGEFILKGNKALELIQKGNQQRCVCAYGWKGPVFLLSQ